MITDICNDYFDMIKYYKQKLRENIEDTSYDAFCLIIKNKNKKKGFSQFIGELYLKGIIDLDAINKITSILVNNIKTILIDNELDLYFSFYLGPILLRNYRHKGPWFSYYSY